MGLGLIQNITQSLPINNHSSINDSSVLINELKSCSNSLTYKSLSALGILFNIHNPYDHQYDSADKVPSYEVFVSFLKNCNSKKLISNYNY